MASVRLASALLVAALAIQSAPVAQVDVQPPVLTVRSPAPGATSVAMTVLVQATFSEAVQPGTIVMQLRNAANQLVAGATAWDAATLTSTFDPAADLSASQTYTITVSGARDVANNLMAPASWTFTTGGAGFQDVVLPQTGLVDPTVIQFADDGRLFVAEKSGRVYVFDGLADATPTLVVDLRTSVYNYWDRGMLGMALHPNFPSTPLLYVLYAYDAVPGGTAPRWGTPGAVGDNCPSPPGPTGNGCVVTGRLSRFNVGNQGAWPLDAGDEDVLITDWFQQFPSHSIGSILFGADGALYVSGGDGASFNYADYGQTASTPSANDPANQGGALRSQDVRSSGDPTGLAGAVIRVDPDTGAALPDNPRASDPDANGKRIVAYGLRNPFRMTVRPGTNELWVGDVGWTTWESIYRIVDGGDSVVENFGWPCYEAGNRQVSYDALNLPLCESLYSQGNAIAPPHYAYNHSERVITGETCPTGGSSISGLAFYPASGGAYPAEFNGALFFSDYSRNCIWAMRRGADGLPNPDDIVGVRSGGGGPVHLVSGPGGDVFYIGLNDDRLHRLQYTGGNRPPVAVAAANPTSGPAPLTVTFSGAGSTDPEGSALAYAWDLDGDGSFDDAAVAAPVFTYPTSAPIMARLKVTDPQGLSDIAAVLINNSPPVPAIAAPAASLTWKVGDTIAFGGGATDAEDGPLPPAALHWQLVLHHCPSNCHAHAMQTWAGVSGGTFAAPDHEYPSHLELQLTATDSGGLSRTAGVILNPQTVTLNFASDPAGLELAVGPSTGVTPFARTVIVGSSNSISAPAPQAIGANWYGFSSWSDGGAQTHNIVAPAGAAAFTASFSPVTGAPGLVAAYGFNEGAGTALTDATGKGHTGIISGATWSGSGRFGGALAFDGANDLVTIADANDLDLTTGMTLEAWVFPTALSGWRTAILKETNINIAYGIYAHDNAPRPAAYFSTGGGDLGVPGAAALTLNAWTHLALTYDGATARFYVNGTQVGTRAAAGPLAVTSRPLFLGGNSLWGEWFAGRLDEVRVYDRALSPLEIQADMNLPVTAADPEPEPEPEPDTTPPGVSVATPSANALLRGTVVVGATASDDSGTVASVQFLLDGAPLGAPDTAAPFTVDWSTALAANGDHTVSAIATDPAGNPATAAPVVVTVDNSPPQVSVNAMVGTLSGTVNLNAQAADNRAVASVQFRVNAVNVGAPATAAPFIVPWNSTTVANGTHQISAVATDTAGNQTLSADVAVTVANVWTAPSGLVAAYTFSEGAGATTADASGGGNTGAVTGAAWSAAGRFGSALSFDGVNDLVSIADAPSLDVASGLTVEAWVRPSALTGWRTVALKGASSIALAWALYAHDNGPRPAAYVLAGGVERSAAGTAALPLNTWTHVAMTYGGGSVRFYVNGALVGTRAHTGAMPATAGALEIGGNTIWGEWFAGLIDEVRIYNRPLTQAEIQAGMAQTIGGL